MPVQVSKISSVEVIPLEAPDATAEDLDGAAATVIVRLTDEAGRTGIGKTDGSAACREGVHGDAAGASPGAATSTKC